MARKAAGRRAGAKDAGARRAQPSDPEAAGIDAALRLAAERGWSNLSLADIATEAGVPISDFYRRFATRQAILNALQRRTDLHVLQSVDEDPPEGSRRDRLFDVLMRRFDALQPYREGLQAVARASCWDPLALVCGAAGLSRSMAAMLEAAGISSAGLPGLLRTHGLAAAYLTAFRVWLRDDTEDKSHTMSALDRALRRADFCLSGMALDRRRATAA